jgi:hypothetical protein
MPSNCTIRAKVTHSYSMQDTTICRIRLHVGSLVDVKQGKGDISATCTKAVLQEQLPPNIKQLNSRLVVLNTEVSSSQSI